MSTITVQKAVLQQALEALVVAWQQNPHWQITEAMNALRKALAQQEQEPVAWVESPFGDVWKTPPRREQEQEQEQEPVAQVVSRPERVGFGRVEDRKDVRFLADLPVGTMLYTAPPRREWQGLTEEEINALPEVGGVMWSMGTAPAVLRAIHAALAALKEKNQ